MILDKLAVKWADDMLPRQFSLDGMTHGKCSDLLALLMCTNGDYNCAENRTEYTKAGTKNGRPILWGL